MRIENLYVFCWRARNSGSMAMSSLSETHDGANYLQAVGVYFCPASLPELLRDG